MALTSTPTDVSPANYKQSAPAKYIDLNDFLNAVDLPDNRDSLIPTFGDGNITGFLEMCGAVTNVGEADFVTTWEETRLMPVQVAQVIATAATAVTQTYPASTVKVRLNDVVILEDGSTRAFVTAVTATGYTVSSFSSTGLPAMTIATHTHKIIGNMYAQGSEQPTEYYESNVNKRTNGFNIIKDIYKVTGSQATNKAWITLPNGQRYWYLKSQEDMNKRFKNWRETMLLLGEQVSGNATARIADMDGSEGYFSAVEEGGIVTPSFAAIADIDNYIDELDVQGAISDSYAMFLNTVESRKIDDMLATGLATGGLNTGTPDQYGEFANGVDLVKLGFKSFDRSDRVFHKTGWKLLNDEAMLRGTDFKGAIIPTGMSLDAKSGKYMPPLEMNYKSAPNENRLMKSWVTGSALGAKNQTGDYAQFNYLSEVNLVTRARNQHGIVKY